MQSSCPQSVAPQHLPHVWLRTNNKNLFYEFCWKHAERLPLCAIAISVATATSQLCATQECRRGMLREKLFRANMTETWFVIQYKNSNFFSLVFFVFRFVQIKPSICDVLMAGCISNMLNDSLNVSTVYSFSVGWYGRRFVHLILRIFEWKFTRYERTTKIPFTPTYNESSLYFVSDFKIKIVFIDRRMRCIATCVRSFLVCNVLLEKFPFPFKILGKCLAHWISFKYLKWKTQYLVLEKLLTNKTHQMNCSSFCFGPNNDARTLSSNSKISHSVQ